MFKYPPRSYTMIKSVRGHFVKQEFLSTQLVITVRNILRRIQSLKLSDMLSEDMKYRLYFFRSYLPELYRRHIKKNYRNCLFCSRLVKTGCHKYCLKCSAGTYIKCCPPLPGFLYDVAIHAEDDYTLPVPWYYQKPCPYFKRLPLHLYWRNIYSVSPSIAMNNYEVLEGLERGLVSGTRPCHICASVDYDFYKRCRSQPGFDSSTPCPGIRKSLKRIYEDQPEITRHAV